MSHSSGKSPTCLQMHASRMHQRGVTLIELIVVMVIIGILAAVAVPSYRQYVVRSQRADATAALLTLATAQEKFYLDNNAYADSLADLRINGTEHGWYTLAVSCADAGCEVGFTATATPVAGGPQATDGQCRFFATDDRSQRLACKTSTACTAGSTNDTTEQCWR